MKQIIFIITGSWFLISSIGCEPDPPIKTEVSTMDITINHFFGSNDFRLDEEYTLPSNEQVKFSRYSYLLSDFYLIDENDFRIALNDQYLYADIRSSKKNLTLTDIPKGPYTGIGFSIGLDSIINHGNPNQYNSDHPLSPINNSLHWSWKGGYIFAWPKRILKMSDFKIFMEKMKEQGFRKMVKTCKHYATPRFT